MSRRTSILVLALTGAASLAPPAFAADAARIGDLTSHGGVIVGPGAPTVVIAGRPAARVTDSVSCPLSNGTSPHVGGPIVTGSVTVRINGLPAARAGSIVSEVGATSVIVVGTPLVLIGP